LFIRSPPHQCSPTLSPHAYFLLFGSPESLLYIFPTLPISLYFWHSFSTTESPLAFCHTQRLLRDGNWRFLVLLSFRCPFSCPDQTWRNTVRSPLECWCDMSPLVCLELRGFFPQLSVVCAIPPRWAHSMVRQMATTKLCCHFSPANCPGGYCFFFFPPLSARDLDRGPPRLLDVHSQQQGRSTLSRVPDSFAPSARPPSSAVPLPAEVVCSRSIAYPPYSGIQLPFLSLLSTLIRGVHFFFL